MTTETSPQIRRLLPLVAVCVTVLAAPSLASAAQRYATPSPAGGANCAQQDPCSLQTAVESAVNGDEVIVGPGTYSEGADPVQATKPNMSIHGAAGEPRPQINFNSAPGVAFVVSGGGTADLHHLRIDAANGGTTVRIINTSGAAEDLIVHNSAQGACEIYSMPFRLRDSICATTGGGGQAGLNAINQLPGATHTLTLRNVTAVGSGSPGFGIYAGASSTAKQIIDAKNVIASGGTGGISADVLATNGANPSAETTINLDHSNYDTRCEYVAGSCNGGAGLSVTAPGSGGNQTAPPLFTDAAFHQDPNSPTVDKGTTDAEVGTADPDGDQRALGAAVDIGADEYVPPSPPPPPPANPGGGQPSDPPAENPPAENPPPDAPPVDTDPPETSIRKAPPNSLQRTSAAFRFAADEPGSTFQCKIDRSAFASCVTGRRYRGLDAGRHRFRVRAIDAAGNVDPTAARDSFRVLNG